MQKLDIVEYRKAYYRKNKERLSGQQKEYYRINKEKINEKNRIYNRMYYAEHKEEIEKRKAEYKKLNPEKRKEVNAKYRKSNPEKVKESSKNYRQANLEKYRVHQSNRRARIRKNGGKLSSGLSEKLFALQKGRCACCGELLGDSYHLDHIMPLFLGGENEDWNIQLLKQKCNNQKFIKHPVDFMQLRGRLL